MKVTFVRSEPEAPDIRTFWFESEQPVNQIAGQFIELTIPHEADDRGQKHWFTLSSSPTEELLSITTRLSEPGSTFKRHLRSLRPGDTVTMSQPMGDFVLPKDLRRPLVFIAGGIGITPIHSMVKWLYDTQEHRTIQIIYAANKVDDLVFRDLFQAYGAPTTLVLSDPPKNWKGETGRLTPTKILKLSPDVDNKLYYLSGPEPMMESLVSGLTEEGLPKEQIVTDYFPGYPPL